MRARYVPCCGSSWSLSGYTISRPRLWSEGRNRVLRPPCASWRRSGRHGRVCSTGDAPVAHASLARFESKRAYTIARKPDTLAHIRTRTHAQAGMTQLGVSHRTAAAAIFYFLREQFNIHDLDFKMWCDEIGLPSSFTARKQDKQHRRVTQLSATQVDSLLRLATCVRCRRRRLCALLQTIPCAPAASARPLHRIASHRIAW